MTRVEFKLFMPGINSWDGKWSGEEQNFTITRELDDVTAAALDKRSWPYAWPDGWRAEVRARIVPLGESQKRSHGFHGYDWMVESILEHGKIYASHEKPGAEQNA